MLYSGNVEPTLGELLSDPITQLLLRRDGLSLKTMRAIADDARHRLFSACRSEERITGGFPFVLSASAAARSRMESN